MSHVGARELQISGIVKEVLGFRLGGDGEPWGVNWGGYVDGGGAVDWGRLVGGLLGPVVLGLGWLMVLGTGSWNGLGRLELRLGLEDWGGVIHVGLGDSEANAWTSCRREGREVNMREGDEHEGER